MNLGFRRNFCLYLHDLQDKDTDRKFLRNPNLNEIRARRPGVNGNWSKATGDEQDSGGNCPDSFWLVNYVYIFCFHVKNYASSKCLPKSGGKNRFAFLVTRDLTCLNTYTLTLHMFLSGSLMTLAMTSLSTTGYTGHTCS